MSRRSIDQILEGNPYKKLLWPEKLQQSEIDLVDTDPRKTQYYVRIVLDNCGRINPEEIEEYIGTG